MIKLVGILVIGLGFLLRWNPLLAVMLAGIATGLAAGMPFQEIMRLFGRFFVDNRFITLPIVLMIPLVAVLEKYGLRDCAASIIGRLRNATAGRVLLGYHLLRGATSMVGLGIGNHASMVRPIVVPMAEGAAAARVPLTSAARADLRAHAAAAENLGNFFADDIIVAVGPVLLIKGFFDAAGVSVGMWSIALWGAPTALFVVLVGWWRYTLLDRRLARGARAVAEVQP